MGVPPHLHIGLGLGPNLHIGSQSADWEVSPVVSVPQNHTTKLLLPLSKLHLGGRQCLASSSSSVGSHLARPGGARPRQAACEPCPPMAHGRGGTTRQSCLFTPSSLPLFCQ